MKTTCTGVLILFVYLSSLFIPGEAFSQEPPEYREESLSGHLVLPGQMPFNESNLELLNPPDGFDIQVFASDLGNPRMIAVSDDGTVYVTIQKENKVVSLKDTNGDGQADQVEDAITDIEMVHGITIHEGTLYLVNDTELYSAVINENGQIEQPTTLAENLPDGGQHPNRTIAFNNEGDLFLSIGSTCNACSETNPEHATMLKVNTNTFERNIFAEGLRNTIGFDWHPETGELWGMDHGSDWRGDDLPPEELNRLEEGNHYGWPFVYGEQEIDPFNNGEPEDMTLEEFAEQSTPSVLTYQAHAAPLGMTFYTGDQFPDEFKNDAFIAFRGSWNRKPAVGYKISRLRFDDNGEPEEFEDFITGFLQEDNDSQNHFGRLAGIAVHTDGSLLFTDDTNGVVYRVSYSDN